jgi:DNA-binding FadR family transcriptional regulator
MNGTEDMFRPARPRRAFDEIISQVRTLVQEGRLTPGSRLPSERALAAQFEVSRNTVREAIRMLEVSGIVIVKKGASGGAFIASSDPEAISKSMAENLLLTRYSLTDLTEAREGIEAVAVRVACERRTDADLQRMEDLLDDATKLIAEERWDDKARSIIDFHCAIGDATQNPILGTVMRSLMALLQEFSTRFGGEVRADVDSQRTLLRHIRDQDADAAVAELISNTRRVREVWLSGD